MSGTRPTPFATQGAKYTFWTGSAALTPVGRWGKAHCMAPRIGWPRGMPGSFHCRSGKTPVDDSLLLAKAPVKIEGDDILIDVL